MIAAVNGHAVGIGLTLAMQCDVRLFALEGKYGFLHVRRGVIPDAYSHWTVPRAIGFARTADLFLTGRTFRGEEAERLGIASRALPAAEVLPAALEIARDIAVNAAPLSVALCKRLLWEGQALSREDVGRRETELHHVVMGEPDALEGVMAFLERRAPRWQLRVSRDWPKELTRAQAEGPTLIRAEPGRRGIPFLSMRDPRRPARVAPGFAWLPRDVLSIPESRCHLESARADRARGLTARSAGRRSPSSS